MSTTRSGPGPAVGTLLLDPAGTPVATVTGLGLAVASGAAEWIVVRTTGGHRTAVPAHVASVNGAGSLVTPFAAGDLEAAPAIDGGVLTTTEHGRLLRHYGLER